MSDKFDSMDIKIAVAYHKDSTILKHKYLLPIQLGRKISDITLDMIGDDTGDNISDKNPLYCELTGLYWLWKNVKADYKGLFHYRRGLATIPFFRIKKWFLVIRQYINLLLIPFGIKKDAVITVKYEYKREETYQNAVLSYCDDLESILSDGTNVIAPCPIRFLVRSVITHFRYLGNVYLQVLGNIIETNYPDIYPYYKIGCNGHIFYYGNISIMDEHTFDEYCTFLFSVLDRHEKKMIEEGYLKDINVEKVYSRIPAFLAELLTNAYILYCKDTKTVKNAPIAFLKQ